MWKGTQQRIQLDVEADPIPESDTETHKANDDNADDSSVDEKIICDILLHLHMEALKESMLSLPNLETIQASNNDQISYDMEQQQAATDDHIPEHADTHSKHTETPNKAIAVEKNGVKGKNFKEVPVAAVSSEKAIGVKDKILEIPEVLTRAIGRNKSFIELLRRKRPQGE